MNAQDLKKGSILEIEVPTNTENGFSILRENVIIDRSTDFYVWFNKSGYQRLSRNTIDKYPSLYKIISI